MKNLSIKMKLVLLGSINILILIFTGALSYYKLYQITNIHNVSSMVDDIEDISFKMRKSEKDFMLRSVVDITYYQTLKSKYLDEQKQNFKNADDLFKQLSDLNSRYVSNNDLIAVKSAFDEYNTKFLLLVDEITKKGFADFGLVGKMKTAITDIYRNISDLNIQNKILEVREIELNYLLYKDAKVLKKFASKTDELKQSIAASKALSQNEKSKQLELIDSYIETFNTITDIDKTIGYSEKEGLQAQFRQAVHQVEPLISALVEGIDAKRNHIVSESIVYLVITLIISILFSGYFISRIVINIQKSLNTTLDIVKAVADGDFSQNINIENNDEIAQLQTEVQKMVQKLRGNVQIVQKIADGDLTVKIKSFSDKDELQIAIAKMLEQLNTSIHKVIEASGNVASGSTQLSATAMQIAQGANEQAASTEEVSASIEEMTASIQQNSDNARQTEKISNADANGIIEISKASQKSVEAIRKITEKISIVNDIAEKTDILAINAAIEAARAGEHGKGFAVVAAEVRKLAEVSQKSAKEINLLSKEILNLTEESGLLMHEIIPNIQKTAHLVREIAAASSEQSSGSDQISKAIEQLSQVTQQNSAAAEQMSTSSEELASQAEILRDAIMFFKIDHSHLNKATKVKSNVAKYKEVEDKHLQNGVKIDMSDRDVKDNEYVEF